MARQASDLNVLTSANAGSARWLRVDVPPDPRVWTDDYSNLLSAIRWKF